MRGPEDDHVKEDMLIDERCDAKNHHRDRFAELRAEIKKGGNSAGELLPVLFRRPLDAHQTFFAMGEAIAHLHYLYYAGEAKRAAGADGIMRYAAT